MAFFQDQPDISSDLDTNVGGDSAATSMNWSSGTSDLPAASSSSSGWASDLGTGLQAGGGIIGATGAIYAGEMESGALTAQANLQRQNAQLDLEAGNANAARSQIISGQKIGGIQSAAAASGVTQSGSVLSVMAASSMNAEMDRQNILHGAQVKAIQADNQASMDELGAQSAMTGSYFKAVGDMFQAGGQIAGEAMGGG